jgi:hypothetical protein
MFHSTVTRAALAATMRPTEVRVIAHRRRCLLIDADVANADRNRTPIALVAIRLEY